MIYDLLLLVDPYRAYGSANYEWTPGPKGIYTAILQVNKQIHQKAKDVLYTSNCWMEVNFRCQAKYLAFSVLRLASATVKLHSTRRSSPF